MCIGTLRGQIMLDSLDSCEPCSMGIIYQSLDLLQEEYMPLLSPLFCSHRSQIILLFKVCFETGVCLFQKIGKISFKSFLGTETVVQRSECLLLFRGPIIARPGNSVHLMCGPEYLWVPLNLFKALLNESFLLCITFPVILLIFAVMMQAVAGQIVHV